METDASEPTPTPALLLQRLRWLHLRNALRLLHSTGLVRSFAIVVSCVVTWGSLFVFSLFAFSELKTRWNFPLDGWFQELLFDLMFFFLSMLLLFSTGILLYTSLFTSPESRFLLTTPLPDDHVFAYKFQGALAFSNWGFLLLGSPVLIAYGLRVEPAAPLHFFAFLPLFFLGFVLLPGSLGAIVCLLVVNFLPRSFKQIAQLLTLISTVIALAFAYRWMTEGTHGFRPTRLWFESFINELTILSGDLKPHHWVAAGLRAAALDEIPRAFFYLTLVWSNGLLAYILAVAMGRKLFRRGVERVLTGGNLTTNRVRRQWLDHAVERVLFLLDRPTRLLIIKDFRTFRRDPAQWLQLFIFVVLLLFYFWGMRRFFESDIATPFKNGISLLTLVATSLLMCAYTGRFIFPLLSLEGRMFWLLGLLPLNRRRLVWGKFAFAACTCLVPCAILILMCDLILGMPGVILAVHSATVVLIACGLSAISVSMGTFLPNFRENDPSKIAIGFGGTLNLVAGFLFLLVVLGLVVLPLHLSFGTRDAGGAGPLPWYIWALVGMGLTIGTACVFVPLRMACRCLERMEF